MDGYLARECYNEGEAELFCILNAQDWQKDSWNRCPRPGFEWRVLHSVREERKKSFSWISPDSLLRFTQSFNIRQAIQSYCSTSPSWHHYSCEFTSIVFSFTSTTLDSSPDGL